MKENEREVYEYVFFEVLGIKAETYHRISQKGRREKSCISHAHSENHKRTSLDGFNLERPGSTAECSLKHLVLDNLGRGGRRSMLVQGQLQAQVELRVGPLEGFEQHTLVVP